MNSTGIVILAAGNSSRIGSPKQNLIYDEKTLLQHVIEEAIKAKLHPVVVVTGANAEKLFESLQSQPVEIVFNNLWEQGMGTSISAGVNKIIANKNVENVILAVCDQPFISFEILQQLIDKKKESGKNIVACSYANTIGTPVLFHRNYFENLLQLKADEGAKKFLKEYNDDVAVIPFPKGNIDIDTVQDYVHLVNS
jgi:molybdenum cofactor cytidylyltransferase